VWVWRLWETNAAEAAATEDDHLTAGQLPKVSEPLITVLETAKSYEEFYLTGCVHRPVFFEVENTTFRKLNLFPSSG
jgi:hypothetical protein